MIIQKTHHVTKVRWTPEEDQIIADVYKTKVFQKRKILDRLLPHRTHSAIKRRIDVLLFTNKIKSNLEETQEANLSYTDPKRIVVNGNFDSAGLLERLSYGL